MISERSSMIYPEDIELGMKVKVLCSNRFLGIKQGKSFTWIDGVVVEASDRVTIKSKYKQKCIKASCLKNNLPHSHILKRI